MIHPATEIRMIDRMIGYGIFATAPIPCGTMTWVRDALDRTFTETDLAILDPATREKVEHFSYRNRIGDYVFCWDNARFINHSFHPNCLLTPCGFEIAVRDIAAGGELTMDYGCLNIVDSFTPRCGLMKEERKTVQPDDLLFMSDEWDLLVRNAIIRIPTVSQPLADHLDFEWNAFLKSDGNPVPMIPSMKTLYFEPPGA